MCGIAGIVHFNGAPVEKSALKKMTDAIKHRGPDGEGQWINKKGNVGLGHRRLSIIDLSDNAGQPMHFADGRFTITFNGEIYNYIELRESLIKKGYTFSSQSDTEVLLALYHLKGVACLQELDGMFAFAIWDEQEQSLFCARDRFGEKPFYYSYEAGKHFYFASEMKALWAIGVSKENDAEMTKHYLETGEVQYESDLSKTFYKKIQQLDASHCLLIKNNTLSITGYFSIDYTNRNSTITEKEAIQKFGELLEDSVRLRLRSDVPVGSSLSGGMDSSSIVLLIDNLKGETNTQNTFSARFKNFAKDEGKYIDAVVKAGKNIRPHEVWPDGEQLSAEIQKLIYHQEEPFASASMFAQWKVMELAKKENVTVLLDGQGADEYLAGYLPYYNLYLKQLFFTDTKKYESEWNEYYKLRNVKIDRFEDQETLSMKMGRLKRKIMHQPMPYDSNSLNKELKRHSTETGLKELLRYADRNAMAHSREVRLPFLSHKLVEFAFTLPDDLKLNKGWTKFVLRKSMENILPAEICWRIDKIGYEPPQKNWIEQSEELKRQIVKGREKFKSLVKNNSATTSDWNYIMIENYLNN